MNYVNDVCDIPIESNENNRPIALFVSLVAVFTLTVLFLTFNTFSFQLQFLCQYYGTIIFISPCVAGFIMAKVYADRVPALSLGKCKKQYVIGGAVFAVLYSSIAYAIYWMMEPASFAPVLTASMLAYLPIQFLTAFGQEVGVRGYFMPVMVNRFGFVKAALFIGMLEAFWQILIVSPAEFSANIYPGAWIICMVSIAAFSVILCYLRLKSNSIWPCVALSGCNIFFPYVFQSSTMGAEQFYFVGCTGVIDMIILVLVAGIILFRFRNEQPTQKDFCKEVL